MKKKKLKTLSLILFSVLENLLDLTDQSIVLTPVTGTSISKFIDHGQSGQSAYIYISTIDYFSLIVL